MKEKFSIPETLARLGIQKKSRKLTDYEEAKQWLYYKAITQKDFDGYMKEVRDYIGV